MFFSARVSPGLGVILFFALLFPCAGVGFFFSKRVFGRLYGMLIYLICSLLSLAFHVLAMNMDFMYPETFASTLGLLFYPFSFFPTIEFPLISSCSYRMLIYMRRICMSK